MPDSYEQIMLQKLGPHMLAAKIDHFLQMEVTKGCSPDIYPQPVSLEPRYAPLNIKPHHQAENLQTIECDFETPIDPADLVRLEVFLSPNQKFDWRICEIFIQQLSAVWHHRLGFEIVGNQNRIHFLFLCHREDTSLIRSTFLSLFPYCEISERDDMFWSGLCPESNTLVHLSDFYPRPPYHHLLTRRNELHVPPYNSLLSIIADVPAPAVAIIQILFQPAHPDHDWHANVKKLINLEYSQSTLQDIQSPRYSQQQPSHSLNEMAHDVDTKAHDDKYCFFTAFRVAFFNGEKNHVQDFRSLTAFSQRFQHGGHSLKSINETDYLQILDAAQLDKMIVNGITYRPGFLLNTVELCGLVHLPSPEIFEGRRLPVPPLETLLFQNEEFSEGIHIGNCNYAETEIPVCIPHQERMLHLHLIGSHGMGKSTVFEHACLQDIERGDGIAVLDPHGDLVERLLRLISREHSSRVIYFDPGDRNWVPLWNPLTPIPNQDIGRTADDLVKSFKTLFDSGWGHRLEHILRYSIISLLHLSGSTFNDLNNLFRKDEASDEF